jgi:coproporphyrinogen III oxidase-like Fe-S oxidoreductase
MMGLRLKEGVEKRLLENLFPQAYKHLMGSTLIKDLHQEKLMVMNDTHITPTSKGVLCLSSLTQALIQEAAQAPSL